LFPQGAMFIFHQLDATTTGWLQKAICVRMAHTPLD
jgi:hypothetical protein